MKGPTGPLTGRSGATRIAGAALATVLALVTAAELPRLAWLRAACFDGYQIAAPRMVRSLPVTIVEIDQKSLAAKGQWPWPRTELAALIDAIATARPAAIALDILMPEKDRLSPQNLVSTLRDLDPALAAALARHPSNDEVLARSLTAAHAVLVVAGNDERTTAAVRAPVFSVRNARPAAKSAGTSEPKVTRYAGVITSIDELDRAAEGRGLISVDPESGIVRRIPLVASIGGTLVPALAIEALRVAIGSPSLRLLVDGMAVSGIAIGDDVVPTESDGTVRIYYSPHDSRRFVSAIDVFDQKVDPGRLQQKIVVIGITGLGIHDLQNTPRGELMSGSEIHAQLVENIYDRTLLRRPAWSHWTEGAMVLALGLVTVWAAPRVRPQYFALITVVSLLLTTALAFALFRIQRLLLDAATPVFSLLLLFGVLLVLTLVDAARQRRSLQRVVQEQREQSARITGELEAARRIQTASLPRPESLGRDERFDIGATMLPARETGGDLYDFFLLDDRHLFFLVGDVAGKGLSASIFMAVSKALYKSATLRTAGEDIGHLMTIANAEITRDNAEMLFVTAFAGILDLHGGELAYCNAGHENPSLIAPNDSSITRIVDGDGPPLCTIEGYDYHGASRTLRRGETLVVLTDGVSEAGDPSGRVYEKSNLEAALQRASRASTAQGLVDTLRAEVEAFVAGAERSDDLTILALRWHGPRN